MKSEARLVLLASYTTQPRSFSKEAGDGWSCLLPSRAHVIHRLQHDHAVRPLYLAYSAHYYESSARSCPRLHRA